MRFEFKFNQKVCLYLRHTFLIKSNIFFLPNKQGLNLKKQNASNLWLALVELALVMVGTYHIPQSMHRLRERKIHLRSSLIRR